jgi:hypothetical protein
MGRWHERDERGEHEGYLVGYVPRDWVPTASAAAIGSSRPVAMLEHHGTRIPLRELGLLAVDREHDVHGICVAGYACACGWRSPYRELGQPLEWSPCIVHPSEVLDDMLAQKWWNPHVQTEVRRTEQLNHGHSTANSVHVAIDLPRQVATDLLSLLNSLGNSGLNQPMKHLSPQRADSANLGLLKLAAELEQLLRDGG